jgi:hypothetical protein
VEKPEVGISYRKEKTADFVSYTQGHFLLWSEDVRKQEFSGRVRAATGITATRLQATINFTRITVTVTQLTRILDRLIRGGISLCGDVV